MTAALRSAVIEAANGALAGQRLVADLARGAPPGHLMAVLEAALEAGGQTYIAAMLRQVEKALAARPARQGAP